MGANCIKTAILRSIVRLPGLSPLRKTSGATTLNRAVAQKPRPIAPSRNYVKTLICLYREMGKVQSAFP